MTRLLLLIAAAALAGCTTAESLRRSAPVAAGTYPGQWRAFAECVNFDLDGRTLYDPATKTALVGDAPGGGLWMTAGQKDYELTIRQASEASVDVELRQRWTLAEDWARDHYWSAVERCGKVQASANSLGR